MNRLGSNRELAENKLILLYFIEKLNMPVGNLQLTKVFLENRFMNYFLLQQFLTELCETGCLAEHQEDERTVYSITPTGRKTLSYFVNMIPPAVKSRIDETISSIRKNIRKETMISADYVPESENEFVVTCKVREDSFPLIEMKVTVGTKEDARLICNNWHKHAQAIYSEIIDSLTKKRE